MFLQHRFFASLKKAGSAARALRGGITVTADHAAPPAQRQELSKVVMERKAVPLSDCQEEERKYLQALGDAAHEPDLLDVHRRIKILPRTTEIEDVHFDNAMDFVRFSKALPHAPPFQYGQPSPAATDHSSFPTPAQSVPPTLQAAVVAEPLALPFPPRVDLQDFSAIKKLGPGASRTVYLVKHQPTRRLFALKKMQKQLLDADATSLMVQEQRMLRKVRGHRNVAGLEASFHDQENFFLVVPFMVGGDIRTELQRCRKFQTERVTFYAAQIVLALEFIHNKGIVHCDIKPEHLLFDAAGDVRLCGFGRSKQVEKAVPSDMQRKPHSFWGALSRARRPSTTLDPAAKPCLTPWRHGTPVYSAPEVFEGKPYGCEVDFWALGIVVYEMATGRTPFKDSTDLEEVYRSVARDEVTFQARDHAELWVQVFIIQLLWKNPADRLAPSTMKDHQFFQKIDWERLVRGKITPPWAPNKAAALSAVEDAERNSGCFKIASAEPVVPDPFPRYAFQSELFANSSPVTPSSAKSSGTEAASVSSAVSSAHASRDHLPEPALSQFPSHLFEFRKFSAVFAAMSPSLSSGSLRRPSSDAPSSSSTSGSRSSSLFCFDFPKIAQISLLPSPGPSPASRKPFANLHRWARKIRV